MGVAGDPTGDTVVQFSLRKAARDGARLDGESVGDSEAAPTESSDGRSLKKRLVQTQLWSETAGSSYVTVNVVIKVIHSNVIEGAIERYLFVKRVALGRSGETSMMRHEVQHGEHDTGSTTRGEMGRCGLRLSLDL